MKVRVLNLGAGVQSTTVYLMMLQRLIEPAEVAIFADTQDEPEGVYNHLRWLQSLNGIPILIRTKGRLSEDLKVGQNSSGGRFASIPAFTLGPQGTGRVRRQCSSEYKIAVIDRCVRREILGLKPKQRVPKDTMVFQAFGISLDESGRATRLYENMLEKNEQRWKTLEFPLVERFMTRQLCEEWLSKQNIPHTVPRSACVYCPFHSDAEWVRIKNNPQDWALAVEVDDALRRPGVVANRQLNQQLFVHRSCKPLTQIEFKPKPEDAQSHLNFNQECLGVCGV